VLKKRAFPPRNSEMFQHYCARPSYTNGFNRSQISSSFVLLFFGEVKVFESDGLYHGKKL
jgi:hypothetical protein